MSRWDREVRDEARKDVVDELREVTADGKVSKRELKGAGKRVLWKLFTSFLTKKASKL